MAKKSSDDLMTPPTLGRGVDLGLGLQSVVNRIPGLLVGWGWLGLLLLPAGAVGQLRLELGDPTPELIALLVLAHQGGSCGVERHQMIPIRTP